MEIPIAIAGMLVFLPSGNRLHQVPGEDGDGVRLIQLLTVLRLEQQARGTVEGQAVLENAKWPLKHYRFRTLCRATGLGST